MIKRCPCCHSAGRLYSDDYLVNYPYYVACTHCCYMGAFAETQQRAIEYWNAESR